MGYKLTDNEKLVMWGLTECPDAQDAELSKKLGLKRRTLTTIKTRLKNNKLFSTIMLPEWNAIGFEIHSVVYGTFNLVSRYEDRSEPAQKVTECEEIIYVNSTDKEFFIITVSKNLTEFQKKANELLRLYTGKKFLDKVTIVHFPLEISKYYVHGFSGIINRLSGLNFKCKKKRARGGTVKKTRLTEKEKKVLYAQVLMPEAKISEVSNITGITTKTVSVIKKKLYDKKLIEPYKIPNFNVLNCELFALIHVKYKHDKKDDHEPHASEILKFDSGAEAISISLFQTYTDYKTYYDRKLEYLIEKDIIDGKPDVMLFPVQKLKYVKNFSFTPILKKVLEIDAEF